MERRGSDIDIFIDYDPGRFSFVEELLVVSECVGVYLELRKQGTSLAAHPWPDARASAG